MSPVPPIKKLTKDNDELMDPKFELDRINQRERKSIVPLKDIIWARQPEKERQEQMANRVAFRRNTAFDFRRVLDTEKLDPKEKLDEIHKLTGKPILLCDFAIRFKDGDKDIRNWKAERILLLPEQPTLTT